MEAVGATVTHRTRVGRARAVSCKRRVGGTRPTGRAAAMLLFQTRRWPGTELFLVPSSFLGG